MNGIGKAIYGSRRNVIAGSVAIIDHDERHVLDLVIDGAAFKPFAV